MVAFVQKERQNHLFAGIWCVSQKWDMRIFWRTDNSLHRGRRRGVREISRLASVERASPDACLADNSLIPACGPPQIWCVSQKWDIAVFSFFLGSLAFCDGPMM